MNPATFDDLRVLRDRLAADLAAVDHVLAMATDVGPEPEPVPAVRQLPARVERSGVFDALRTYVERSTGDFTQSQVRAALSVAGVVVGQASVSRALMNLRQEGTVIEVRPYQPGRGKPPALYRRADRQAGQEVERPSGREEFRQAG